jgi:hypothetical protein
MGELIAASTVIDVIKKNAAPMLIGMLLTLILVVVVFFIVGMIVGLLSKNSHFSPTRWIWKKWPFTDAGSTVTPSTTGPGTPVGPLKLTSSPYGPIYNTTSNPVASTTGSVGTAAPVGCPNTIYAQYAIRSVVRNAGDSANDPQGEASTYVVNPTWFRLWNAPPTSGSDGSATGAPTGAIVNTFEIPKQTDATLKANKANIFFVLYVRYSNTTSAVATSVYEKIGIVSAANSDTAVTSISEQPDEYGRNLTSFCTA